MRGSYWELSEISDYEIDFDRNDSDIVDTHGDSSVVKKKNSIFWFYSENVLFYRFLIIFRFIDITFLGDLVFF